MINIGPLIPPVSPTKVVKNRSQEAAVAGTEINKDPGPVQQPLEKRHQRRKGKDRRQRNVKPLLDLRRGKDRRDDPQIPTIDIEV